eukprot:6393787-Amphidinium_carterae.1
MLRRCSRQLLTDRNQQDDERRSRLQRRAGGGKGQDTQTPPPTESSDKWAIDAERSSTTSPVVFSTYASLENALSASRFKLIACSQTRIYCSRIWSGAQYQAWFCEMVGPEEVKSVSINIQRLSATRFQTPAFLQLAPNHLQARSSERLPRQ